jgi:hypothetical protein
MLLRPQSRIAGAWIALAMLPFVGFAQDVSPGVTPPDGLDPRILQHYSRAAIAEIQQRTPYKLAQLNYYFRESWQLQADPACPACPMPDPATIDVTRYEHLRAADRPNSIQLSKPGPYLVLLPRQVVLTRYQALR